VQNFAQCNVWRAGFLALCVAALLWSQAETGQITGTVFDPVGSIVPNAAITVTNVATGGERKTTSSGAGAYAVTNLQPGQYSVAVDTPGFSTFKQNVQVTVGSTVGLDVRMQVGQANTVVQVTESSVAVNTETQTLSTTVTTKQLTDLPTLTRNPYALVALSGNASDAGAGNRGVGFAINGQREDSTNVLLDGAANNDEFNASVGQQVPLDAVQELSVLTNNFTAEFGRASGGVVNVVSKSGTNEFHGSAYEFNRISKLSSNSFDNNANSIPRSVFTRNNFGYSLGGPIKKNKLFFFSSTEWLRIRSAATQSALVLSNQFLADTAANTQAFFTAHGSLKPSAHILQSYTGSDLLGQCGVVAACTSFLAANPTLPIFNKVAYNVPSDAGGGNPVNQYLTLEKVDWNVSDRTQVYVRYALQSDSYFPGFTSSSPYQGYDTGETDFNNNIMLSATHSFGPAFVSQSKAVFNRLNQLQPFGPGGGNTPTLYTGSTGVVTYLGTSVLMPGYNPATPGSSIPFGGPQNFVQLYEDLSLSKGKHEFRFGGSYDYQRDNRTFGAYEDAGYYLGSGAGTIGGSIGNLLAGQVKQFQVAIYPQGQLPGSTVNYPLTSPNFSRSNRYNEGALYGQDSWKVSPRFTLNIGLRWEYYGTQHNKNSALDSNFYDPSNQIDTPLGIRLGQVALANTQGGLWKASPHNFAPRVGFAWDVRGDGKTSLRGGYSIDYERNFGNVTFNVIQNPPNYETVSITNANAPIYISSNNLGPFSASTGTLKLPAASLRNVDDHIQQAYAHSYSLSLEHQIGNGLVTGADYSGSRGVHLYDIQVLNRPGYGNVFLGDPCSYAAQDCSSYLNNQYGGINRRGSEGYSNYNALNVYARANQLAHLGITFTAAYTWSHSVDNLSSTFSDADNFSNNNGDFITGYLNPYAPMLDKGNSDFDVRHRFTMSAIWAIPAFNGNRGIMGQTLGGWEVAPLFTARTGSPYSIFDCTNAQYFCPRAGFNSAVPVNSNASGPVSGTPNSFNFLNIPVTNINNYVNPIYFYSDLPPFPGDISGRNTFRAPGFWELDLGVYKTFRISERFSLQLRGEGYNLTNHANLYVVAGGADVSSAPSSGNYSITSCRGCTGTTQDRRNVQLAVKLLF
jgi:outer membrane receptor protein involved in Fe transport